MTGNELAGVAGIILSLLFSYIPKLQLWYDPLDPKTKSLIMLGALLLTTAGAYGLSCSGWWIFVTCNQAGVKSLVEAFVVALIANQATYVIAPQVAKKSVNYPQP
jgi:hypothetical protein